MMPAHVQCGLVQRRGAYGGNLAAHGQFARFLHILIGRVARNCGERSPCKVFGNQLEVDAVNCVGGEFSFFYFVDLEAAHLEFAADNAASLRKPIGIARLRGAGTMHEALRAPGSS